MNPWWLLLIVPASILLGIAIGAGLFIWRFLADYFKHGSPIG